MSYIFISLGIGIVVGHLRPLSQRGGRVVHYVTMTGLFIMLMSMGAQLGGNKQVLAHLGQMGLSAVVLSGCSVLGSVALVYLARDYIYRGLEEKLGRRQGGKAL